MKANEFVKKNGLWVFKYALAQLSFRKGMHLVVYHYECEFVDEIKPNHGDCVFTYEEVKSLVESWELVEELCGLDEAKKHLDQARKEFSLLISFRNKKNEICCVYDHVLAKAISDVESCQ